MDLKKRSLVQVIEREDEAKFLVDPMRREILRLLAREELTEKGLSVALGVSPPSIDRHLKSLGRRGLITIVGRTEKHGILQKFYRANAQAYIIDLDSMPLRAKCYFMPIAMERVRGALAMLKLLRKNGPEPTSSLIEKMAESWAAWLAKAGQQYEHDLRDTDPEDTLGQLYRESLIHLLRSDFRELVPTIPSKSPHPGR